MIRVGQQATFPRLLFLANRMKVERLIEEGLQAVNTVQGVEAKWGNESLHLRGQKVGVRDGPGISTDRNALTLTESEAALRN